MADKWLSPTGHNDPDAVWANEGQAYDSNLITYASLDASGPGRFLELDITSILCSKIRFYAIGGDTVDIDLYYNSTWNHLYDGAYAEGTWVEIDLGSMQRVTKARITFSASVFGGAYLYEFEFWGSIILDTQKSLLTSLWTILTGDDVQDIGLQTIMGGTVRLYLTWAEPDAEFPYLVHRIDIAPAEPFPMRLATYYLDIWSDSPNADELLAIRKRIIELLDELEFDTNEVTAARLWLQTEGMIPEVEGGIWHYSLMFNLRYYRSSETLAIIGR